MIYQERLKIEIKLLLSANSKSYMPRRMAQQRMTLSDLGWPFHALCSIFAVAERLLVVLIVFLLLLLLFLCLYSTGYLELFVY